MQKLKRKHERILDVWAHSKNIKTVAEELQYKPKTVEKAVEELIEWGLIEEAPTPDGIESIEGDLEKVELPNYETPDATEVLKSTEVERLRNINPQHIEVGVKFCLNLRVYKVVELKKKQFINGNHFVVFVAESNGVKYTFTINTERKKSPVSRVKS